MSLKTDFLSMVSIEDLQERYSNDIKETLFFGAPLSSILNAEHMLFDAKQKSIAYFSMEYGLAPSVYHTFERSSPVTRENMFSSHNIFSNLRSMDYFMKVRIDKMLDMPIYSGGLGVLAGDTLKSVADLKISLVAIGILWAKGYFKQNFWFKYGQVPEQMRWDPYTYPGLIPLKDRIALSLRQGTVYLKLWKYYVYSFDMTHVVPLILLDANIPENDERSRQLTDQLYRADDPALKIIQRVILGMGGMKAIEHLGYQTGTYHLNEGHAAFAFIEKAKKAKKDPYAEFSSQFAYTCHTPVAAGHDRFGLGDVTGILPDEDISWVKKYGMDPDYPEVVNLTSLAMTTCAHVNAVSQKHGEVTRLQFPTFKSKIQAITNGVHTFTWVSDSLAALFDKYKQQIGDWTHDPTCLTRIERLRKNTQFRKDLWDAHQQNKMALADLLDKWKFNKNVFTMAWARRIAAYKRPSLFMQDVDTLLQIARQYGQIQIIFAGKAHPQDNLGFTYVDEMMNKVDALAEHRDILRIIMLENYDTYFGKLLTNCVDVWLNNPLPPFEASGTSGMKAILNGVVQLSTLDGWVVEAKDKGIGTLFGYEPTQSEIGTEQDLHMKDDSQALYKALEQMVALYYQTNKKEGNIELNSPWIDTMINCIIQSAYFSTHRMVNEYNKLIWS